MLMRSWPLSCAAALAAVLSGAQAEVLDLNEIDLHPRSVSALARELSPTITIGQAANSSTKSSSSAQNASTPAPPVVPAEPQTTTPALVPTKTPVDMDKVMKIAGPVAGGVLGAGALAGVIAISVLKPGQEKLMHSQSVHVEVPTPMPHRPGLGLNTPFVAKETGLSTPAAAGATAVSVVNQAEFKVGDTLVIDASTPYQEVNRITAFGSLELAEPLRFSHSAGAKIENIPPEQTQQMVTPKPMFRGPTEGEVQVGGPTSPDGVKGTEGDSGSGDSSTSSMDGGLPLMVMGVALLAICMVALCVIGIFMKKKKKKAKRPVPPREDFEPKYEPAREDLENQPLNYEQNVPPAYPDPQSLYQPAGGMDQSQYMPVTAPSGMPPLDMVPMQTMAPSLLPQQPMITAYNNPGMAQAHDPMMAAAAWNNQYSMMR